MARRLAVVSVHPAGHSSAASCLGSCSNQERWRVFKVLRPVLLVSYPVTFVVVFFGVALPEEIGWRGFALPRMQPRYGPLWGTLLLGVLWGFWHVLYFLTPDQGGGPGTSFATFLTNFPIFLLMVIALAIIFTWVFNHTRGSIFIATLLHASIDTPQLVWIPLFLAVGDDQPEPGRPHRLWGASTADCHPDTRSAGLPAKPGQQRQRAKGHQAEAPTGKAEQPLLVRTWKEDPSDARHGQTEEHAFTG